MLCINLKLSAICNNMDANNFDYHLFLFIASYLMLTDSFILELLKTSGEVTFRINDSLLPSLYALLKLNFDLPLTQTWFECRFKFYNSNFISSIRHLPYQAFRRWFLNFNCHNKRYQDQVFNDFLGSAHCTTMCDICTQHDQTLYSHVNLELSWFGKDHHSSKFRPFARDYNHSNQIFNTFSIPSTYTNAVWVVAHLTSLNVTFTIFRINQCWSTHITIIYLQLTKILYTKCHSLHNELYKDAFEILPDKLGPIYWIPDLHLFTILKLSLRQLRMVKVNILPVGLDLDIDFKVYHGLIDHKLFFPQISHCNKLKYSNTFLA